MEIRGEETGGNDHARVGNARERGWGGRERGRKRGMERARERGRDIEREREREMEREREGKLQRERERDG